MSTYKGKDGRWRYRFAFRGKRYSGSAPKGNNTKAAAQHLEKQHADRAMRSRYTGTMPTVAQMAERMLEYQKPRIKPLTYEQQEKTFRLHVVPHLGKMPLDRVGPLELANLVTTWSATAAPNTVNNRLLTVKRMFSLAVEWEIIPSIPRVKMLKVPQVTPRFLSDEESAKLLEAAATARDGTDWYSMMLVALRTGLRIGELRGLQWGDIDLAKQVLMVRRTDPGRKGIAAGSPKSGKGRVIPLANDATACLAELLDRDQRKLGRALPPSAWVWRGIENWGDQRNRVRPRSTDGCSAAMVRYTKKAGLVDVGWHTLRHTFASQLVMRGVSLKVVQELLGHSTIRMTERYAHLAPGFVNHAAVSLLEVPLVLPPPPPQLPPGAP